MKSCRNQQGFMALVIVGIVLVMISAALLDLFRQWALEERFLTQKRVVASADLILDSYANYFVNQCNNGVNPVPNSDVPTLIANGWHLFKVFNPSNATLSLAIKRPTTTTSSTATGSRTLNQSSTILQLTIEYDALHSEAFKMLTDALAESELVFHPDYTNTTVTIEDQVINRREASQILDESVFNQRACI